MINYIKERKEAIAILLAALLVGWLLTSWFINTNKDDIRMWTERHGESATNVEFRAFYTGPYYWMKNTRVYRVETKSNVYWFRYGLWSPSVYREITNGEYQELKYE